MEHLHQALAGLLLVVAAWLCWTAFQIKFKGRTDLVRFGSGPLPGAALLQTQFAWLILLQGVASATAGGALLLLGALQPTVWVFLVATAVLSVRRALLVRSLELHAAVPPSEA